MVSPTLASLYDPRQWEDPYDFYRMLRTSHSIYWDRHLRSWVVSKYSDILRLSGEARLSGDRVTPFFTRLSARNQAAMRPLADVLSRMMLFTDGAHHERLRRMVADLFIPRRLIQMRGDIGELAGDLLDRVVPAGRMDVIRDFAAPLTKSVIAHLLGLKEGNRALLDDWVSLLHEFFSQSSSQLLRLHGLRSAFDQMLTFPNDQTNVASTMMSHLVRVGSREPDENTDLAFANFVLLIDAGQVTTTHMIANAVRALIRNTDQLELLQQNLGMIKTAVYELLRFDSSVQLTNRIAISDFNVNGCQIRSGDALTLLIGAGNHDPERFRDPDRLDLERDARRHLSFGHGTHYCLGGALAVMEMEVALTALLSRVSGLRLATDRVRWRDTINFRFPMTLPILFEQS